MLKKRIPSFYDIIQQIFATDIHKQEFDVNVAVEYIKNNMNSAVGIVQQSKTQTRQKRTENFCCNKSNFAVAIDVTVTPKK